MKSFRYAWRGIVHAVKTERNMRIHLAAVYYVVAAGRLTGLERRSWAAVALAFGMVIGAEMVNTALEKLCDGLEPGHSPVIGSVKDIAAGAVLVCAIAAVGVAAAVFWGQALPEDFLYRPVFWAGVAAAPVWGLFVFGTARLK